MISFQSYRIQNQNFWAQNAMNAIEFSESTLIGSRNN